MNKIIENVEAFASQKEMPHKEYAFIVKFIIYAICVLILVVIFLYAKKN